MDLQSDKIIGGDFIPLDYLIPTERYAKTREDFSGESSR